MSASGFTGTNRGDTNTSFRLPRPVMDDTAKLSFQQVCSKRQQVLKPDEFWNDLQLIQTQKVQLRQKEPTTGHVFIDFELNDAQIETKVKQLTQREMNKQQNELKSIVEQRTGHLREFVESQIRSSQLSLQSLRGDIKQQNIAISTHSPQVQQSQALNSRAAPSFMSSQMPTDLKSALISQVQETLAQETLQCKPIRGVDIPLSTAPTEILSVEEIESRDQPQFVPQRGGILSMLLPNELKVASLDYLEESDMLHMDVQLQPKKTPGQTIRETKLKREYQMAEEAEQILAKQEEDQLLKVSGKEREKTIKCLLKVLQFQVHQVEDQASEVLQHAKQHDRELAEFRKEMVEKERQINLQEMQYQLEATKRLAGTYKPSTEDEKPLLEERLDIAEIITDNQLLMARLDQLLTHDGTAKVSEDQTGEDAYSLTSTLVDELYEQVSAQIKKKKIKQNTKPHKSVVPVHQTHPVIHKTSNKKSPSKVKISPKKQEADSVLKKSKSKDKIQVSLQESYNPYDFRAPMSQAEIDRLKKKQIEEVKNRHQIVNFNQVEEQVPIKTSKRQNELERLDKLLNQEVTAALSSQAKLMEKVFN